MLGTRDPLPGRDTAVGVLSGLCDAQARVDVGEIDKAVSALAWAVIHSGDTLVGPISTWEQHAMPIAGAGAPEVAEFCVAELAASLGVSTDSGRSTWATSWSCATGSRGRGPVSCQVS